MSNKTSAVVKTNPRKAVMIGCGFVGSASVFALMQSGLFSEIVLIDADKDKAEGEAMDISHGIPFARPMKIYAGGYDDVADAAIIVVSAGAGQKPGETRLDLVNKMLQSSRASFRRLQREFRWNLTYRCKSCRYFNTGGTEAFRTS